MKWRYTAAGTLDQDCVADASDPDGEPFARLEVDRLTDSAQLDIAVIGKEDGTVRILISADTAAQIHVEVVDERGGADTIELHQN